jgi:hypothetical protein
VFDGKVNSSSWIEEPQESWMATKSGLAVVTGTDVSIVLAWRVA